MSAIALLLDEDVRVKLGEILRQRGYDVDCALPTGEFSPRFEGSAIGGFSLLNLHLVFLWG